MESERSCLQVSAFVSLNSQYEKSYKQYFEKIFEFLIFLMLNARKKRGAKSSGSSQCLLSYCSKVPFLLSLV